MTNEAEAREQTFAQNQPKKFRTSDDITELAAAFTAAQSEFKPPKKTATAQIKSERANYTYKYAPLDEILEATRPALNKAGIGVIQPSWSVEASRIAVQTVLLHKSGQMLVFDPIVFATGGTPQGAGAAITYAKRYSLSAALGVAAEEDTDAAPLQNTARRAVNMENELPPEGKKDAAPKAAATTPSKQGTKPPQGQTGAQQGQGQGAAISGPQVKRLKQICNVHGVTQKQMKTFLQSGGINRLEDIPVAGYDAIVTAVQEGNVA